jgi:hypothetical protein
MAKTDIVGFKINRPIFCDLCGIRRDKGGWGLRAPITGAFCSAEHARIAVDRWNEKNNKE